MTQTQLRAVTQQPFAPQDLDSEFFDCDETLVFSYVLLPNQNITNLQQPISLMGDFYLCAIQATSHNFPSFGALGTSIDAGFRFTDSTGYRLLDGYAGVNFFAPSQGNSFPYSLNPQHRFAAGTYIGIDLQEQSNLVNTIQIAFKGRYRYRMADVIKAARLQRGLHK